MKKKDHPEYQYLNLLRDVLETGIQKVDRGTDARLYSLFGKQTRYDLAYGFPLLTTKRVYWKGVLHELYWFLSGQTSIKYLVDNNVHIWDDYPYKIYNAKFKNPADAKALAGRRSSKFKSNSKQKAQSSSLTKEEFIQKIKEDGEFAKKWGELPKIYGEMWRRWPTRRAGRTIDQLQWVIDELTEDPDAKNAIVNSWNPEYLYTMALREEASLFPICHNMYQVSIRGDKLSLQLYQRSADLFLGVPFNIASYALLTIILAQILKLKPGEFIHTFGDVHIYENHVEQVKEQLSREPRPFPRVAVDPAVKTLADFTPDAVTLEGYDPHPPIRAELTVAGGFYEKENLSSS